MSKKLIHALVILRAHSVVKSPQKTQHLWNLKMEFFWLQKMEPFEKTSRFAASFFGRLFLVGGFNPVEKSSDWIISPSRGEIFKKCNRHLFFFGGGKLSEHDFSGYITTRTCAKQLQANVTILTIRWPERSFQHISCISLVTKA